MRSLGFLGAGLALLVTGGVLAPDGLTRGSAGQNSQHDSDGSGAGATHTPAPAATPSRTPTPSGEETPAGRDEPSSSATEKAPKKKAPKKKAPRKTTIPSKGSGKFHISELERGPSSERGRTITVQVRVEEDLPFDSKKTASSIAGILDDERSWAGAGQVRFRLVGADADPDLKILLATPRTTDRYCLPLRTGGTLSCQVKDRVVLNANRWAKAVKDYDGDVANYRRYLVNHEVGHFIGYGHVPCPGRGAKAPVMMQQTKGLDGCKPNAWPTGER